MTRVLGTVGVCLLATVIAVIALRPATKEAEARPPAPTPTVKTYTQADIDERDQRIASLESDNAKLTEERNDARATASDLSRMLSDYVEKEQKAKAAQRQAAARKPATYAVKTYSSCSGGNCAPRRGWGWRR